MFLLVLPAFVFPIAALLLGFRYSVSGFTEKKNFTINCWFFVVVSALLYWFQFWHIPYYMLLTYISPFIVAAEIYCVCTVLQKKFSILYPPKDTWKLLILSSLIGHTLSFYCIFIFTDNIGC